MKIFKQRAKNTILQSERIAKGLPPWTSMSFSMGGWLQFYLYGVGRAIQERGLDRNVKYCGSSAGALTAGGLAIGADFDLVVDFAKNECLRRAYDNIFGLFRLSEYVGECIDLAESTNGWPGIEDGVLNVAVTKLPTLAAERVSSFKDFKDFKSALLASTAAFPFAQLVRRDGSLYIDGGLTDFQPIIDEDTVTVSPFYFSDADIKPSRYVPLWWTFFPPNSPETVDWLYHLGWEDALRYFDSRDIPQISSSRYVNPLIKSNHPFDNEKQVTMRRLLGYDYSSIHAHIIMFILDFFLLLFFLLIFKPLALMIIYVELYINMAVYGVVALIGEVTEGSVVKVLAMIAYITHMGFIGRFVQSTRTTVEGQTMTYYTRLWECIACVSSLSLFLRFISLQPSNAILRKHKHLEKLSLCYRFFRHFI